MARPGDTVAVLGVTYKPNTYITEEAAGLFLAQQLKRRGYRVLIHDFAATPANSPSLHEFERISDWEEFKDQSRRETCGYLLSLAPVPGLGRDRGNEGIHAMALVNSKPMDAGPSSSRSGLAYPDRWIIGIHQGFGNVGRLCHLQFRAGAIKVLAREPRATAVCPSNTHILGEARHNPEFARVLARFDLVLPDGMPVVWALNFRGAGLKDRVYGPYFMRHALRNTPRPWRHFFFGDSEECLVELRRVLVQLQPDIEIVGMLSPPFRPFTEADEASFADTINRADPDFVWVALPGVRMEQWIIDNQARYRRGVFLAVGDAFTLLSGRRVVRSAWMQRMGLTWAYRLSKEPLRLGPRYLRYHSCSYLIGYGTPCAGGREKGRSDNLGPGRIPKKSVHFKIGAFGDQTSATHLARSREPISSGRASGGSGASRMGIGFRKAATAAAVATGSSSMGS